MKKSLRYTLTLLSAVPFGVYSQSGKRLDLGPPIILNEIQQQHTRTTSSYSLLLTTGELAPIHLENYYFSGDGALSMNGIAEESPNSLFILKGDRSSIYGYLALRDSKKAYEITTRKGITSIEEVDIARIFPDLYETIFKPPMKNGASLAAVNLKQHFC